MRRCLREIALLVTLLICGVVAGSARADGRGMAPAAKAELDRGLERYKAKDYAGAIAAFDAGYAIDAKPEFLYVKAQAQRMSGDCRKAIETYLAYLATHPPEDKVEYANANIERCENKLAAEPASGGTSEPSESEPAEPPTSSSATPPPPANARPATTAGTTGQQGDEQAGVTSRWRDRRGLWLAGSGAVALGVGVTFAMLARGAASDAGAAEDIQGWEAARDTWARDRRISEVATVVGLGLGVFAAVRFATREQPKRRVSIGVGASGKSAGVLLIGGRW